MLKKSYMDIKQVLKLLRCSDGCFHRGTYGLHMNVVEFRWMLPQSDLWISCEQGGV